jgi:uncharacterized membrane protein YqjE
MTPIDPAQEGTMTLDSRPEAATTPPSTPELVTRLSQEVTQLVRDELRLAQLEVTGKAKTAGVGVGMFGAAGVLAWFGFGTLVATAVLALALVLDAWLAALIVAVVLFAAAAVAAALGRNKVRDAAPPLPQEALASTRADIDTAKEAAHR